jgi:hypothetical protein
VSFSELATDCPSRHLFIGAKSAKGAIDSPKLFFLQQYIFLCYWFNSFLVIDLNSKLRTLFLLRLKLKSDIFKIANNQQTHAHNQWVMKLMLKNFKDISMSWFEKELGLNICFCLIDTFDRFYLTSRRTSWYREFNAEQNLPQQLPNLHDLSFDDEEAWFAVSGMYGGFSYRWLDNDRTKLTASSWSRVCGGSGQAHEITKDGAKLIDEGFVWIVFLMVAQMYETMLWQ